MGRPTLVLVMSAAFLVLAMGVAACGTADMPPGGGGPDSTSAASTTPSLPPSSSTTLPQGFIAHLKGGADVVLRVSTGGGFVPIEYNYTLIPEFTLYGDGRIIVTGPTTLEYPGEALPNLQTTTVSEDAVQAILAAAKEAGLFRNGIDYGTPGVADVGTTTITVNAEGASYISQIYALGFDESGDLTREQQQARAAVEALRGELSDPSRLTSAQPSWEAYEFTALKVFSSVAQAADTASTDIRPDRLPWPLADLATSGKEVANTQGLREVVVSGDELTLLKPLLERATQITFWRSGDHEYNLFLRPLLPDEATVLDKPTE